MLKLLKNENFKAILILSINLILGILFVVFTARIFNFVESIFCVCLLGLGTLALIFYTFLPSDEKIPKLFLFGMVGIACGIFILIWPRFFGIVLSVIIALSGVGMILDSLKIKKAKAGIWLTDFIVGISICVLSVVTIILSGTNVAKNILAIFFGIMFLTQGILQLVEFIKREKKTKAEKALQKTDVNPEEDLKLEQDVTPPQTEAKSELKEN